MATVASIAKEAMDAVALEITDAIQSGTLTHEANGVYDPATGDYSTVTTTYSGRVVVDTETPIGDVFGDYIAGPEEVLLFLEGFGAIPAESWEIAYQGQTKVISKVSDLLAAGTTFYVVAR